LRQFERCTLGVQSPGTVGEHEAKVDMDQMAGRGDHDVAVMPVLDLEQVGDERVACKAFDKIARSHLILNT
jgi:hypothetical protein